MGCCFHKKKNHQFSDVRKFTTIVTDGYFYLKAKVNWLKNIWNQFHTSVETEVNINIQNIYKNKQVPDKGILRNFIQSADMH